MKNNTLRYLIVVFAVSLVLLLVSSVASFVSIKRLVDSSNRLNQANTISLQLETLISHIKDAETSFRGFVITQDSSFLEPYRGAYKRVLQSYLTTQSLTIDNPAQQKHLADLKPLVEQRFRIWEKALNSEFSTGSRRRTFNDGKVLMDQIRVLVDQMETEEARRIDAQNESLKLYNVATPILIVGATLISLLIMLVAFFRIRNDFTRSQELQGQLEASAASMQQRVAIISGMVQQIFAGDYTARIHNREDGELGALADALNSMAAQLEKNARDNQDQEWLRQGYIILNDQVKGEKSPEEFYPTVLNEMAHYLKVKVGIFYKVDEESGVLSPAATYACPLDPTQQIKPGEGLVGQVARDKTPLTLKDVPDNLIRLQSGLLDGAPTTVIIYPLVHDEVVQGVVELGLMDGITEIMDQYLFWGTQNVANHLVTAKNRWRVHDLLLETQAQAEELEAQQEELQRTNVELEMQAQRLQASEEELKVQQEELLQSNQELEEKAQLLEEKNHFIDQKSRELVQLYRDLEEKNRDLEQASRYKSEFLANMSHELRTPLNSILLLAKLLADSKELDLGEDRYEYARVIHNSGMGLLELINEILDLSKIEAGQMEVTVEQVSFQEIRQDLMAMFSPLAKEKDLELVLDFDPALPASFPSDKLRLEQILKNLLSNAIKFTEKGSVSLLVKQETDPALQFVNPQLHQGPVISFRIKDTGIGIPADKQALVFEAFKQVDGSSRRKYGGTGLGLSISREIAKLLGGEIRLESEPGKGSTFTVYLPLQPGQSTPDAPANPSAALQDSTDPKSDLGATLLAELSQPAPPAPTESVPDDRDAVATGDKIMLIVEDDIPFVKALLPFIRSNGYKVLVATRGDEGLTLARRYQPAGILLDINLPVMDGWTVMEHLKQDATTRHIPVHTMSSDEARRRSLNAGAIDFINKPLAEKELGQVLHRIEAIGQKATRALLIIEEHQKHAHALARFFRENNIETAVALSGEEGLTLLRSEPFDSVILNISVDERVAFDILDQIKRDKRFEALPVIVYTGHTLTSEDEKRINQYAATSIVKKANTYEKLLNEVSIFLHLVEEQRMGSGPAKQRNQLIDRDLAGKAILIADDDERNIYSLSKALQRHDAKVITAVNGKEVLAHLATKPHLDAILIDMMMPEMDGYETTRAIRQDPDYKDIPVIAVTAKTMPNDRNKCIEAGASDYIAKPVDIDQLLSLLRVWLY